MPNRVIEPPRRPTGYIGWNRFLGNDGLPKRLQIGARYKLHSSVKMYLPDQKKTEAMLTEELLKTKKVKKIYYFTKTGKISK
jgi:hypothetical protein